MQTNGLSINFLGDSITKGCGTSPGADIFVTILRWMLGLAAARNYGVAGSRIARQRCPSENPAADRDFCQRAEEMEEDADVVLVFGGTNDFGHGDAPMGTPDDRSADSFYGACHVLFSNLKKRYPAAVIGVITPLHRLGEEDPWGEPGYKKTPCAPLSGYVHALRQTAEEFGLPVLDLYAMGLLNPNDPEILRRYVPDGVHPNDEGHRLLAAVISRFLQEL